jgi:hypothetical protein
VGKGEDLTAKARGLLDEIAYMVLGTADADGRPLVSPVYFAHAGYVDFFWVSSPQATHSQNLAARPEVFIVVFDSTQQIGSGRGVYVEAEAAELSGEELERGIAVFSARSQEHGAKEWTAADVTGDANYRLYRARAQGHSMLDPDASPDRRIPVSVRQ